MMTFAHVRHLLQSAQHPAPSLQELGEALRKEDMEELLPAPGVMKAKEALATYEIRERTSSAGGLDTLGFDETLAALRARSPNDTILLFVFHSSARVFSVFVSDADEIVGCIRVVRRDQHSDQRLPPEFYEPTPTPDPLSRAVPTLIAAYRDLARAHGEALEKGDEGAASAKRRMLNNIYVELRRRGNDAQRALLELLRDNDRGVRARAGLHSLDFAQNEGEPVLTELAQSNDVFGADARNTLEKWRAGTLSFP